MSSNSSEAIQQAQDRLKAAHKSDSEGHERTGDIESSTQKSSGDATVSAAEQRGMTRLAEDKGSQSGAGVKSGTDAATDKVQGVQSSSS